MAGLVDPFETSTSLIDPFEKKTKEPATGYDIVGGLKTVGGSLLRVPENFAAAGIEAIEGQSGASVIDNKGYADRFVNWVQERNKKRQEGIKAEYGDKEMLPGIKVSDAGDMAQSLGFSGVGMATGLATGVGTGFVTKNPAAAWTAGGAASGAAAYRIASHQFTEQYLEAKNEERLQSTGKPLTKAEEEALKKDFSSKATQYGLWEAIPEAIGNVGELKALIVPLKNTVGKKLATKIMAKMGSLYGLEGATEAVTQMGQQQTESEAGLTQEKPRSWTEPEDWWKSAKEVFPAVFLQSSLMAGLGGGGAVIKGKYGQRRTSLSIQNAVADDQHLNLSDEDLAGTLQGATDLLQKRKHDKGLGKAVASLQQEAARRQQTTEQTMEPGDAGQTEQTAPPEPNMPTEETPPLAQGVPVAEASPTQYENIIQASATKYGIDPALVKAVIQSESGFRNGLTSPKGAAGLMQLMPGTAKMLGVNNVMDPVENIEAGTEYLAGLLKKVGGDEAKALAAYNWGPGNLAKHGLDNAPKETRDYIAKIQANKTKFGGGGEAMLQTQPAGTDPKEAVILFKNAIQTGSIPLQEAIAKRSEIISEFPEEEDEINKAIIEAQASRPLAGIAQEETPIITESQPTAPSPTISQPALPQQNEVDISELQNRIAQQESYLDTHQGYRGTEIYKSWQDTLVQDKVKLAELTGGIPVKAQTIQTSPANLPAQPEIVQPGASSQEGAGSPANQGIADVKTKEPWESDRTFLTDKVLFDNLPDIKEVGGNVKQELRRRIDSRRGNVRKIPTDSTTKEQTASELLGVQLSDTHGKRRGRLDTSTTQISRSRENILQRQATSELADIFELTSGEAGRYKESLDTILQQTLGKDALQEGNTIQGMERRISGLLQKSVADRIWRSIQEQKKKLIASVPDHVRAEYGLTTNKESLQADRPSGETVTKAPEAVPLEPEEIRLEQTDEGRFTLDLMKEQLQNGTAGTIQDAEGDFSRFSSHAPWFREIAKKHKISAKDTIRIIDKVVKGKSLTQKQEKAWRDIRRAAINEQNNNPLVREFSETLRREYERAATELKAEGIDASAIEENKGDIIANASETPGAEGLTPEVLETNAAEVESFFDEIIKETKKREPQQKETPKGEFDTGELEGFGLKDTFGLLNPETDMSQHKPLSEQKTAKNEELFAENHIPDTTKKVEKEAQKQPWQMTPEEYAGNKSTDEKAVALAAHPQHVKDALAEGKKVPIGVLEKYKNNVWAQRAIANLNPKEETKETDKGVALYNRSSSPPRGITTRQVNSVVDKVKSFLKAAPKINVVQHVSECPKTVLNDMKRNGILDENGDADVQGFAWKGQVWLVGDNIDSPQEALKILMHELTHDGLGKFLSANTPNVKLRSIRLQYKSLMDAIYQAHEKEVKKIARTTHTHLDVSTLAGQRQAAEEWLCNQSYQSQPKWYDKLVTIFHDIVRAIGFDVKLSDSEVRTVLQDAFRNFKEAGKEAVYIEKSPEAATVSAARKETAKYARSARALSIEEIIDQIERDELAALEAPNPETKESRLAVRLEKEAIAKELTANFGDLAEYKTMNMQEQADMAQDVMNNDYDLAKRMAMGEIAPPPNVRAASMFEAVKIRALDEGDVETLHLLATESTIPTMLSQYGQEIKAADSYLMADPVKAMQTVIKHRIEETKKTKGTKAQQAEELATLRKKLEIAEKKLADYQAKKEEQAAGDVIEEMIKKPARKKASFGSKNKLVTVEEFQRLREELRNSAKGTQLNAFPDPTQFVKMVKVGVFYIEGGLRDFSSWSKQIIEDVGDWINPHAQEVFDESLKSYHTGVIQGIQEDIRQAVTEDSFGNIGKYAKDLAKHFISLGITEREELFNKIHDVLKAEMPDHTRRDTMKAISGYGEFKPLDPDAILTKFRDFKGQILQIAKLEDLIKTGRAEKTGFERQTPSDEERRLTKLVEDAKRKYGIETVDKDRLLKSALDAIKTRLKNQIKDLEYQIETRKKIVPVKHDIKRDAEARALEKRRDELKADFEAIFGKTHITDEQRLNAALKITEKSIAEYYRRIKEGDVSGMTATSTPLKSALLDMMRGRREELRQEYKHLKDLANPKKTPEEIALRSLKTRLRNEAKKYSEMLDNLNFEPKPKRERNIDAEGQKLQDERDRIKKNYQEASKVSSITKEEAENIVKLSKIVSETKENLENGGSRFDYGAARVAFEKYIEHLKGRDDTISHMARRRADEFKTTYQDHKAKAVYDVIKDSIQTISDTSISLVASLDNSFIGRQGLKVLMTHPTVWWPAARESFRDIRKVLGGQDAHAALMADIYSRPNCLNGAYDTAKLIPKTEEQFPTSMPERVPYAGRMFKASQTAFEGAAIRMRTDLYDLLSNTAEEAGQNVTDKTWIEDVGRLINSLTARGAWGKRGEPAIVRVILWAPKMLKANLDVLTAHGAGAGLETGFARKEAALNLLKIVGSTAVLLAMAAAMGADVEDDPRSTDFGKIKVGDTRFDVTGGAASIITLAARLLSGSYKSASTGLIHNYGTKYAARTRWDAFIDFLTNKTSPPARVVVDMLKGKNWKGEPFTWSGAAYQALTPISIQNAIKLKDEASADRVLGVIADFVGVNTQSFTASEKAWDEEQSKEMKQFHDRLGADKFKEANKKYNDRVNSWYDKAKNNPYFQKLTDDQKSEEWRKERAKAKKAAFREYHFWPKREKK